MDACSKEKWVDGAEMGQQYGTTVPVEDHGNGNVDAPRLVNK